jgi:hypothetical protein
MSTTDAPITEVTPAPTMDLLDCASGSTATIAATARDLASRLYAWNQDVDVDGLRRNVVAKRPRADERDEGVQPGPPGGIAERWQRHTGWDTRKAF